MAPTKNTKKQKQIQQITKKTTTIEKKNSNKKKTTTKSSCSCLPWLFGIIVLFGGIGALLNYDVTRNGNGVFEKSATGKFLKDTGALPYVEVGATKTLHYSARGYKWGEENFPIYFKIVREFLVPYINFGIDLSKITFNIAKDQFANIKGFIIKKTPLVSNYIEQYAPGLPQKIQDITISTCNTITNISITTYTSGCDFFKTKVFVDITENFGKSLVKFQECVADYYSWFHKKVDAHAKISD